ncbi:MAG: Tn7 transposase TnsA N-terminal domain-containing protein, partial [Vulcanimicrobiaceae bacterium]
MLTRAASRVLSSAIRTAGSAILNRRWSDTSQTFSTSIHASRGTRSSPLSSNTAAQMGGRRTGTPDFLVHYTPESGRRPELVDVKYRSEIFQKWQKLKPRLRAARAYALDSQDY